MKYLSVCSGMEAASVAWHDLGFTPIGFSEIEPFPCEILKQRFPNTPNYGDLTKYKDWPIEPGSVDLLVGGTPCQAFSVAGLRRGLADPRGNLALIFLGLADHLKPRWILWENVPGVLTSSGGRDFGSFLAGLAELGYSASWRILDAQNFGVAQRRRRVFVVAHLGDWKPPTAVLFESESLRGDSPKGDQKRKGSAPDAGASPQGDCLEGLDLFERRDDRRVSSEQDKPVVIDRAAFNQGANALYTPLIQSSETMPTLVSKGPHAVGQVPFRKSKKAQSETDYETWVPDDKSNCLNCFDVGDTRSTVAIVEPVAFTQNQREEVRELGDTAGTLNSQPGTHQQTYIAQPKAFMMREDATNNTFNANETDTALCLQAMRPAVTSHHAQNIIVQPTAYILDSFTSNSMLSDNPNSGCREVDKTKCLDTSCLNPSANQGGVMVLQSLYENHPNDSRVTGPHDIAPTVTSRYGTGGGNVPLIQAIPIDSMNLLSRLGEASDNHSLQNFVEGDPMFTLTKGHHHAVAVTFPIQDTRDMEKSQGGLGLAADGAPSYTLDTTGAQGVAHIVSPTITTCKGSKGGSSSEAMDEIEAVFMAQQNDPIAFQPGNLRRKAGADPSSEVFPTIKCDSGDQSPHVCAPTLTASNDPSRSPQSSEITNQVNAVHQAVMQVRRLTPRECERLQGFPDDWSKIAWKGKSPDECPDGPRYKACGNSMAVPVMRWIGARIQQVDKILKEEQSRG
jgi:DNA-cytosine methyltransferase